MTGPRYLKPLLGLALGLASQAVSSGHAAAESWGEAGPRLVNADMDWRHRHQAVMRLGLPAERWSPDEPHASGPSGAERCRKWRAVADSLGETFAGHTLRKTLVRRHCDMFGPEEAPAARWDWPWNGLERGRLVPPRLHRSFGAWAIRCGTGSARRRCALVHEATAVASDGAGLAPSPSAAIVTHFVIDRVAGREVLLWRLFVPRPPSEAAAVAGIGRVVPAGPTQPAMAETPGEVRFKLGPTRPWERFPVCVAAGCLMEVRAERAGEAATHLADGQILGLELRQAGGPSTPVALPTRGFAPALAELIRLRRNERRPEGHRDGVR